MSNDYTPTTDEYNTAHDTARYLYEGRNNWGLVRAENGGIQMSESYHSDGWEQGFRDGWRSARNAAHDAEVAAKALEEAADELARYATTVNAYSVAVGVLRARAAEIRKGAGS